MLCAYHALGHSTRGHSHSYQVCRRPHFTCGQTKAEPPSHLPQVASHDWGGGCSHLWICPTPTLLTLTSPFSTVWRWATW